MIWALSAGGFQAWFNYKTLNFIIDETGITSDFWFIGLAMLYGQLICHFMVYLMEMPSINILWLILSFYAILMWPLNIWLNDNTPGTWYYKN
jgi:hypothetical protein